MEKKKWFVANLKASEEPTAKNELLIKIFEECISNFRDKIESWHYLWESSPFPHTLLLRFYGDSEIIDYVEKHFKDFFDTQGIEYEPDETYDGEASRYGIKGWQYVMKILRLGADFAMDLINNEKSKNTDDFSRGIGNYVDRWIHFFLNQLRVLEYRLHFDFYAHRYVINQVGEQQYQQISTDLQKEIPKFFAASKKLCDDFINERLSD